MKSSKIFPQYKFKIRSEGHSKVVQQLLFSLGYHWCKRPGPMIHISEPALYADEDGCITYSDNDEGTYSYFDGMSMHTEVDVAWLCPENYKLPTVELYGKTYLKTDVVQALSQLEQVE